MTPAAIGFLGAGQMATAIARGWNTAQLLHSSQSLASDPDSGRRGAFNADTGIPITASNLDVIHRCRTLVLAVKPQVIAELAAEIGPALTSEHLVISIAAGVTLAQLGAALGGSTRLIRVMPNTPALVGASATAISAGPTATPADAELALGLFRAIGVAVAVPEKYLDAVTGLSGSGPAYVYVMIEALADGGVRAGLPRDIAMKLAAQTVLGSAKMVLETGQHPGSLKDAVASPGGTTIAGLHALEQAGFRGAIMNAVLAASARAAELGTGK